MFRIQNDDYSDNFRRFADFPPHFEDFFDFMKILTHVFS